MPNPFPSLFFPLIPYRYCGRMIVMNRKGFSLIELLVVVAIIGILAAVGIVAYSGYTASAKINAVKSNLTSAIKYIESEKVKCALGDTTVFGTLECTSLQGSSSGLTLARHLFNNLQTLLPKHVNPYDSTKHFFPRGGGVKWEEGFAYMSGSGTQVQINTCLAKPCTGDNKIQTFIQGN